MSEFTRPRGGRGTGRARMAGPRGLAPSPVASSAGQTRSAKFRPNLSMAGKRIEASDQVASSSHRPSVQPRGGRGRGRAQRRGRGVIVAAEGIFSEGLSTSAPSSQLPSDLGRLSVKEKCMQVDPTETDEQALDDLMDDNKSASGDEDVISPVFVLLKNAPADPSVEFEGLSELLRRDAEDQLEDRLYLMKLPRALPYLLGWVKPIPKELKVPEEMDIENADEPMAYLVHDVEDDDEDERKKQNEGEQKDKVDDEHKDKGEGEHEDNGGDEHETENENKKKDGDKKKDEPEIECYLDVHRSGKLSLRFETFKANWIRLPVETSPSNANEKVCRIGPPVKEEGDEEEEGGEEEEVEDEGEGEDSDDNYTLSYLGEPVENLNCFMDEHSMSLVNYFIEM